MSGTSESQIEIAVTGNFWMGHEFVAISSMVRDCFSSSKDEIQIAAYSLGENAEDFVNLLGEVLAKGIRIQMVINRFGDQPAGARKAILSLAVRYPMFVLKSFDPPDRREDLHAKLIVIDHSVALVGSANLTWKGMVANHELMIRLYGSVAYAVGELIDRLFRNSTRVGSTSVVGDG